MIIDKDKIKMKYASKLFLIIAASLFLLALVSNVLYFYIGCLFLFMGSLLWGTYRIILLLNLLTGEMRFFRRHILEKRNEENNIS